MAENAETMRALVDDRMRRRRQDAYEQRLRGRKHRVRGLFRTAFASIRT
jgi:hypothetical protein